MKLVAPACIALTAFSAAFAVRFLEAGETFDPATGVVYLSRNADQEVAMASTTKIMTALVAITYGKLDATITIGSDVLVPVDAGGSNAALRVGDKLTLRDLLYALLLPSGDDAAGPPNHDRDHGDAEQQHAIERGIEVWTENEPQTLRVAHRLEATHQNYGGKRYPDLAAKTAEHNDGENRCRLHEGEGLWADEALAGGKECAGKTAKHGPGRESGELGDGRVDAERAAGNLVLA